MSSRACARRSGGIRRSYTLIELLIVVAILGIAATMVVPNISGRDRLTIQAAIRTLIADLSFAQSDALAQQEYRRVHFPDPDGDAWATRYAILRVTQADFPGSWAYDEDDAVLDPMADAGDDGRYIVDLLNDDRFEGVEIQPWVDGGANRHVSYDPLGGTVTNGLSPGLVGYILVRYQAGGVTMQYVVTVGPFTGRLTVTKLS